VLSVVRRMRRHASVLVPVVIALLAFAPASAFAAGSQVPTPPPSLPGLPAPGTPPTPAPALPSPTAPPSSGQPAPSQNAPAPQRAPAPSSTSLVKTASPKRPERLVQLTSSSARLSARAVSFSVRCQRSAHVTLTRRGRVIGSGKLACRGFSANVKVALRRGDVRILRRTQPTQVTATFRAGKTKVRQVIRVSTRGEAGAGTRARASALWFSGGTICGNQFSYPYGLQIDPGYLSTYADAGQPDYAYYKIWGWTAAEGWFSSPWSQPFYVATNATQTFLPFELGTALAGTGWTAWAIEKYWWYGGQHETFYLGSQSPLFGNYTSGSWCYQ
jgi:hypothetical protein